MNSSQTSCALNRVSAKKQNRMYEYQIPVRILPRVRLEIMMESATILLAKYLATRDGTSVHTWTMYNQLSQQY